jgi:hypothetical protein
VFLFFQQLANPLKSSFWGKAFSLSEMPKILFYVKKYANTSESAYRGETSQLLPV